jgi:glucose-6-phosphate 1-dehydrogenase
MNFDYAQHSPELAIPDAYERLVVDALSGDSSLFIRSDEIELSWEIVDPLVNAWEQVGSYRLGGYECGSWGPALADEFIDRFGLVWIQPESGSGPVIAGSAEQAGTTG